MSIDTPVFPRLDELENAAMRREPLKVSHIRAPRILLLPFVMHHRRE